MLISEHGDVLEVQILSSSGDEGCDILQARSATQVKYRPGEKDGEAVRGWTTMRWGVPPVGQPPTRSVAASYQAPRTAAPPIIDGRLDDPAWDNAPSTGPFIDIRGEDHPAPSWATHAKMLWDDTHLYVGAWMEEPHLWGTLTDRDAIIYHDHDFEVFLDPDGDGEAYFEIEINVLGTEFDLFLDRAYNKGGQADIDWDLEGLRTAIFADGTINDNSNIDRGWGVEMAIPWSGLVSPDGAVLTKPPSIGDTWRVNFSRVQWPLHHLEDGGYERAAEVSFEVHEEDNWVWSPQGEINMHIPEMWGFVHFVEGETP